MLKIRTLFSGVGSPEMALKALGVNYELVDFCEVDKYAIKSYCAIHNVSEGKNLGDVTKVWGRDLPYADMMVWGFPCQDISVAGKQLGIVEGQTRSGLYYEGLRILKETKPKYSIIENVKNLVGKKFKAEFEQMLKDIDELGYNNYWQVLNAKDYGIPQNRERVFIVSVRKDVDQGNFKFPEAIPLELKLKDMLEDEVDEKYYLSEEYTKRFIKSLTDEKLQNKIPHGEAYTVLGTTVDERAQGTNSRHWVYDIDNNISTLDATMYKQPKQILVKEATKKGYAEATVGDSINIQFPNSKTRRGRVGVGVGQTLETSCNQATLTSDCRIRKLTPLECWRLMGFADEDFHKAKAVNSDTQLYKQAGNSIVKHVLMGIFKNLLEV